VGFRDRAAGGARGIYSALGRSADDSAERPAECPMHHAGDNSSQGSDSFRFGPVFHERDNLATSTRSVLRLHPLLCTFLC
jgi:hypothetical protein